MATKKKVIPLPHLKRVREEAGLSMRDLHEASGASISTIHGLETSGRGAHRKTALRLAEALGVEVSVLAGGEVDMDDPLEGRIVVSGPPRDAARGREGGAGSGRPVSPRSGTDEVLAHLEAAHRAARRVAEAEGRSEEEVLEEVERQGRSLRRAALLRDRMRPLPEALELARTGGLPKPGGTPEEHAPNLGRGETLAESVIEDRR
ncbi:MAG TPA: helix-turn-helix transcriptional regulator [Rubrobacter sp.]|nr:helix-turn-helix transcriptional regulator [Rubrobacter sp.]